MFKLNNLKCIYRWVCANALNLRLPYTNPSICRCVWSVFCICWAHAQLLSQHDATRSCQHKSSHNFPLLIISNAYSLQTCMCLIHHILIILLWQIIEIFFLSKHDFSLDNCPYHSCAWWIFIAVVTSGISCHITWSRTSGAEMRRKRSNKQVIWNLIL